MPVRTMLPLLPRSPPLLLLLLLLLVVAARASGNDAISVAARATNGRSHIQPEAPSLTLIKREASGEEPDDRTAPGHMQQQELDWNDFNLQAEASIPEDIFDQHNDDIDENAASQLQYADPADDEPDESEAADIILESQRPTSRNFSVYLAKDGRTAKKYHNSGSNGNSNKSQYNYKLKNNKESRLARERVADEEEAATKSTSGDGKDSVKDSGNNNGNSDKVDNEWNGNAMGNGNGNGNGNDSDDEEDTDEEDTPEDERPNANFDSKSFAYKKFKNMHEQQNQQSQKEQQQTEQTEQQQQANTNGAVRQLELPRGDGAEPAAVEQLFDSIEILNERKFNKASGQSTSLAAEDVAAEDIMAIGDIEDNFGNDKVLAENIKSAIDNDESAATPGLTATSTTAPTSTSTQATATTTTAAAAGAAIGRKQKRHGGWTGGRYYEKASYGIGRIQTHHGPHQTSAADVGELHYYGDSEESAGKSQANYFASYSGHTKNDTKQPEKGKDGKVGVDGENSEDSLEYSRKQRMPELELESTLRYQPDATTSAPSAFERFKALRRSSRRNGHKSHKKRYKDYLKHSPTLTPKYALKLRQEREQRERERERERQRERKEEGEGEAGGEAEATHAHAAPIFAVGVRPQRVTAKPFYEGQVNYYDHQDEADSPPMDGHHTEMERLIATDNGNWYRRISPVLRNGIKSTELQSQQQQQSQQSQQSQQQHLGKQLPHHHHHLKHHYHHQHHHHKHARQRPPNPYQRKSPAQLATPPTTPEPPLPPPKQQLGHQITELEQLERYYAKWPHLARVQFQVYDEHYREAHPELYADYETNDDDDYETAAELEEAQQDHGAEANLPPYIKKYNRRNKQLLNLLEGTLSPPTPTPYTGHWSGSQLQPGPHESAPIRLDDEYLKQKRRRYQQRAQEDLFAAQQHSQASARGSSTTTTTATPVNGQAASPASPASSASSASRSSQLNQLPDEDKQLDEEHQLMPPALDFWQKQVEAKALPNSTPKPALFKLPLYPAIAGSFLGTQPRSRSAQFVANVSGRGQSSWQPAEVPTAAPSSPLSSFVYHRVVDGVGIGPSALSSSSASRKQRLPFVAITDRRLESSGAHKLIGEHKDFEQNHFPMP